MYNIYLEEALIEKSQGNLGHGSTFLLQKVFSLYSIIVLKELNILLFCIQFCGRFVAMSSSFVIS